MHINIESGVVAPVEFGTPDVFEMTNTDSQLSPDYHRITPVKSFTLNETKTALSQVLAVLESKVEKFVEMKLVSDRRLYFYNALIMRIQLLRNLVSYMSNTDQPT